MPMQSSKHAFFLVIVHVALGEILVRTGYVVRIFIADV